MAKGFKSGGRQPGSQNKRTVQRVIEGSQQIGEIKKLGQKKATAVLNDLMHVAMGLVALYQRRVMTDGALLPEVDQGDIENMREFMKCAGTFAKALGPFQDPTFRAMNVTMEIARPEPQPGDDALTVGSSKVTKLDDPAALGRVYAQMVKRVA